MIDTDMAIRMRGEGIAWETIGKIMGVSGETIRRRIEPGYAEHRNAGIRNNRERYRGNASGGIIHGERYHIKPEEAARALATVPPDTRSFSARAMGDPLPGRSALDRPKEQTETTVRNIVRVVASRNLGEFMEDRYSNLEAVDDHHQS